MPNLSGRWVFCIIRSMIRILKTKSPYHRLGIYPIPYILGLYNQFQKKKQQAFGTGGPIRRNTPRHRKLTELTMKGQQIKMSSQRLKLFNTKGTMCVTCGLKGLYFALEKHVLQDTPYWHFNLYGASTNGDEIMLTKDHIVAKANGGGNTQQNYQVMCMECNQRKADS